MDQHRRDDRASNYEPGFTPSDIERDVNVLVSRATRALTDFVREKPHAALAVAALAGFVVGGGMTPSRIVRWGVAIGGPVLSRTVLEKVSEFLRDTGDGEAGDGGGSQRFRDPASGRGGEPAL